MSLQLSRVMRDFCKTPSSRLPWTVSTECYFVEAMVNKFCLYLLLRIIPSA